MTDATGGFMWQLWSDNPNAPDIPYYQYVDEKFIFAGTLVGSILYGTCKTPPPHIHLPVLTPTVRLS